MRLLLLPLLALTLDAQTASFEVASIRPSHAPVAASAVCRALKPGMENVQIAGVRLSSLIIEAYEADAYRFDLADWTHDGFDIAVRMPPNTSVETCRQMLKSLLAERFHMVTAVETHDMPIYFLKVAKGGLKLKSVEGPPADLRASVTLKSESGRSHYVFRAAPMSRLFTSVGAGVAYGSRIGLWETDRVEDETGLKGYYDGELEYEFPSKANDDTQLAHAPSFQDALVEQLGLTLELRKVPRKVLVIRSSDHKPSEN